MGPSHGFTGFIFYVILHKKQCCKHHLEDNSVCLAQEEKSELMSFRIVQLDACFTSDVCSRRNSNYVCFL